MVLSNRQMVIILFYLSISTVREALIFVGLTQENRPGENTHLLFSCAGKSVH